MNFNLNFYKYMQELKFIGRPKIDVLGLRSRIPETIYVNEYWRLTLYVSLINNFI